MKSSEEAISIFADYLNSIKNMQVFDTIKDNSKINSVELVIVMLLLKMKILLSLNGK
jgi:hypothetical protein